MVVEIAKAFEVTLCIERREDGGVRVWSKDLPTLVLSHSDPAKVIADIPVVLQTILSEMLGGEVEITQLVGLQTAKSEKPAPAIRPRRDERPRKVSFAASLAH